MLASAWIYGIAWQDTCFSNLLSKHIHSLTRSHDNRKRTPETRREFGNLLAPRHEERFEFMETETERERERAPGFFMPISMACTTSHICVTAWKSVRKNKSTLRLLVVDIVLSALGSHCKIVLCHYVMPWMVLYGYIGYTNNKFEAQQQRTHQRRERIK